MPGNVTVVGAAYIKELLPDTEDETFRDYRESDDTYECYEFRPWREDCTSEEFHAFLEEYFGTEGIPLGSGITLPPFMVGRLENGVLIATGPVPFPYGDEVLALLVPAGLSLGAIEHDLKEWRRDRRP